MLTSHFSFASHKRSLARILLGLLFLAHPRSSWASSDDREGDANKAHAAADEHKVADDEQESADNASVFEKHAELLQYMLDLKTRIELIPDTMKEISDAHKPSAAPYLAEAIAQNTLNHLGEAMGQALRLHGLRNEALEWFKHIRYTVAIGLSPRSRDGLANVVKEIGPSQYDNPLLFARDLDGRCRQVIEDFWEHVHLSTYDSALGRVMRFEVPNEYEVLDIAGRKRHSVPTQTLETLFAELPDGSRIELAATDPQAPSKLHLHVPIPDGYEGHEDIAAELHRAYETAQIAIQERSGAHHIELTSVPGFAVPFELMGEDQNEAEPPGGSGDPEGHPDAETVQHVVAKFVGVDEVAYVALIHDPTNPLERLRWLGTNIGSESDVAMDALHADERLMADDVIRRKGKDRRIRFEPGMPRRELWANRLTRWQARRNQPARSEPPTAVIEGRLHLQRDRQFGLTAR